ncbi:hypothetical protein GVN20_26030 [Runella sp. CRIBMP]|uniref:hypothetical protein n=1 Tax=Runella sp. CRIBMP TaxID=2683261 RepID=UPI0014130035|nr:hypothetical protein [Runella sp. CRIBMP]NBB22842.1 hypothetical protein [Runella sp. CRIBMP]
MKKYYKNINISASQISLFLLIFQSVGVRIIEGAGTVSLLLVILLNHKGLRFILRGNFILLLILYSILSIIQELDIKQYIINILQFIAVTCLIGTYLKQKETFLHDLKANCRFLCIYATVTFLMLQLLPQLATPVFYGYKYVSIFGVFINADSILFGSLRRISSLTWEPGCFQLITSIYLLILISEGNNFKTIIWVFILQILSGSTTGYGNLLIILVYVLLKNKVKLSLIVSVCVTLWALFPLLQSNFFEKFKGVNSQSGIIRMRDLRVGLEKLAENPIFGFNTQKLRGDRASKLVEEKVWASSNSYTTVDDLGYFAGGYTNGLLGLLMNWGGILGALIIYMFYNSQLITKPDRYFNIFFFTIFIISTLSEPITNTSFFYMFPMAFLYNSNFYRKKKLSLQVE